MNPIPLEIPDKKESTIRITFGSIEENIGKHDNEIKIFLQNKSLCALITYFEKINEMKFKCDDEQKYDKVHNILIEEITSKWYNLTMEDFADTKYQLLDAFLSKTDYSNSKATDSQREDLEDFLARMVYHFFVNNPETSLLLFDNVFKKIKLELITPKTLWYIIGLPQCAKLRSAQSDVSDKIIKALMVSTNNLPRTESSRFPQLTKGKGILKECVKNRIKECVKTCVKEDVVENETPVRIMSKKEIVLSTIKPTDRFDIKDKNLNWFVGRIIRVDSNGIVVGFDGWIDYYNETITRDNIYNKLAELGTMTNGISHIGGELCACSYCSKENNQEKEKETI